MKRAERRAARERQIRRHAHLVWVDPTDAFDCGRLFNWSQEKIWNKYQKDKARREKDLGRAVTAPHKFVYKDDDYTRERKKRRERIELREFREQVEELYFLPEPDPTDDWYDWDDWPWTLLEDWTN